MSFAWEFLPRWAQSDLAAVGKGWEDIVRRGLQQSFLYISAEKHLVVRVLKSPQNLGRPYSHLAKPAVLFLVQSACFPQHFALFLFTRQPLLFIFKPAVHTEWESSQKTLRCPWKHRSCCWITRIARGLRTHRQVCPAPGRAQRTWRVRGDPTCVWTPRHASRPSDCSVFFSDDDNGRSHVLP